MNKTYTEALDNSQVFDQDTESVLAKEMSACQLTQRTKALFLDQSHKAAVEFFRSEHSKREDKAKQRKELMVALYDNIMNDTGDKRLTFDQFKQRYQRSALFSKRVIR